MKYLKKHFLLLFIIIFMCELTSCGSENKKNTNSDKSVPINFSNIMVLSKEGNGERIYSIKNTDLKAVKTLNNVSNINYNKNSNIIAYTNIISQGTDLTKNYISIANNENKNNINSEFSYMDSRLSPSGKRIALRSFSKDSLFSAEGLSVYNTNTGKKIDFDKKVIVSGDLYRWDSQDDLLYYGVEDGQKNYGKIFSYDFKNSTRKIVFDEFKGYCTFFAVIDNDNIIYIENDSGINNIYYYDTKNNKTFLIGNTISSINDYVFDSKNKILYFIGTENSDQDNSLYKLTIDDRNIKRLTYDFPKIVDKTGGMAIDDSGKVYFCGLQPEDSGNNIYMYIRENNSVNLVTNKAGTYHIIQDSK
ncbi:DPP IV N-terminal domain-containing protein [Clostridium sp.]|uniref:DPP IV N-terminal domain-containing protein n=1 Tax=Clostridium sp. TaxID=1506 RepID=UPI0025874DC8|nr:DPP IV N-terminal domain-containing protein [Clostridium sp.]MDF2504029.1 hypothetical protein [Clostridium sp.]